MMKRSLFSAAFFTAIFGTFGRYITNLRGTFVENVKKVENQPTLVNISANSKQNSKIFKGVNLGPRDNRLTKKTEGRKFRDTVPLRHF
jgi:hypothetical protein